MFTTILYSFSMISVELTQTDDVLSRNESSPNELKNDDFFGTKETPEASLKDQKVKE